METDKIEEVQNYVDRMLNISNKILDVLEENNCPANEGLGALQYLYAKSFHSSGKKYFEYVEAMKENTNIFKELFKERKR